MLAGFVPDFDATAVARLRDAGAVIVGKTVTTSSRMGRTSRRRATRGTRTAIPAARVRGRVSAVAVRSAFGALGSDSGASIRVPGSVNGVIGVKPTFGRISRYGVIGMSPSLDHVGPLARTVEDAALLLGAVAGYDAADPRRFICLPRTSRSSAAASTACGSASSATTTSRIS